ncbi:MAG: transglycosylase domain-containing protein [Chloroflexota bacterium]
MTNTTRLIRQRIQAKRSKKENRSNSIRIGAIISSVLLILLVLPIAFFAIFSWINTNSILQAVPSFQDAVEVYSVSGQGPSSSQFLARAQSGEVVVLSESEAPSQITWITTSNLNAQTINGVYAIWPDIFIDQQGGPAAGRTSVWLNIFQPVTEDRSSSDPLTNASRFILSNIKQDGTMGELLTVQNELGSAWEKEQLAEWSINTGYFGNQQFGLNAAARFYYDREGSQLTLPEIAMLLGTLTNPENNPLDNPAGAKLQQELVLEAMLRQNFITQEQFIAARFSPLDISREAFANQPNIVLNRFLAHQVEEQFKQQEAVDSQYAIITSIDPDLQRKASCLSDYYLNYLNGLGLTGSLDCPEAVSFATLDTFPTANFQAIDSILTAVFDAQTGRLLALNGSGNVSAIPSGNPQYPNGQIKLKQAFYPFVYATALSQGHALSSMVIDVYQPDGDVPFGSGPIFLEEGIRSNSPAAVSNVLEWVGEGNVLKTSFEMGLQTIDSPTNVYDPLSLSSDVEAGFIDLIYAYGVLANSGAKVTGGLVEQIAQPSAILQVENERGEILFENQESAERLILPSEVVWLLNQSLNKKTLLNGQIANLVSPDAQLPSGEWSIGYTPELVVAVWAGNSDQAIRNNNSGRENVTVALWEMLMNEATQSRPVTTWPVPESIVSLEVCWPSGLQPNGLCPTREALFVSGTEPIQFDTMYKEFLINSQTRQLATSSTPADLIEAVTVQVFPPEAQKWAQVNGFPPPPADYDPVVEDIVGQGFNLVFPEPFSEVPRAHTIELDLVTPQEFESFRIAFYEGLSPGRIEIVSENNSIRRNNSSLKIPIQFPDNLEGLITILITGFREDGSIAELAVPVSIKK